MVIRSRVRSTYGRFARQRNLSGGSREMVTPSQSWLVTAVVATALRCSPEPSESIMGLIKECSEFKSPYYVMDYFK